MTIHQAKPMPVDILTDWATLLVPTASGFRETELSCVRIQRTSAVTDYAAGRTRDVTELVMYYDCVNSSPENVEFAAGQTLVYCGESYDITEAKLFCAPQPHHYRITARKTGGEFQPE